LFLLSLVIVEGHMTFFLNAQNWDLHEIALKLGGKLAMAKERWQWLLGTP
jgi:hypothetical protein